MFQISLQHTSPFLTFAEKFTERHIWRQTQREGIDIKKTEKMFLFVTLTNYLEEKKRLTNASVTSVTQDHNYSTITMQLHAMYHLQ